MPNLYIGQKVTVNKPFNDRNLNDINLIETSIKDINFKNNTFTLRGLSKYIFDINTLQSLGIEKLNVCL